MIHVTRNSDFATDEQHLFKQDAYPQTSCSSFCTISYRLVASRGSSYCSLQSPASQEIRREMDPSYRGHGCREHSLHVPFLDLSSDSLAAQHRLVHGAVDNIRKSLEWAGLDYDYGLYSILRQMGLCSSSSRTWGRRPSCIIFPGEENTLSTTLLTV